MVVVIGGWVAVGAGGCGARVCQSPGRRLADVCVCVLPLPSKRRLSMRLAVDVPPTSSSEDLGRPPKIWAGSDPLMFSC